MPFEFLEKFGSRPGLERIEKLLADWGNPERKMKVVLVSGTNGKGSTTAFLASILKEDGKKVGSYFSPHLLRFNERIRVNGEMIPDSELERLEGEIKKWIEKQNSGEGQEEQLDAEERDARIPITYFEAVTACAFRYFEEQEVEYAIMEVGMGGRLDAVNAAEEEIAIITSVGLDHTRHLGSRVSQIAFEKAGIMKKGLAISGVGEGLETIRSEARKRGINLLVFGEDFDAVEREVGPGGSVFDYSDGVQLEGLGISMPGRFQVRNAALAVCAAENLGCSEIAIREGLKKARIRGRMEVLGKEPLVVADAAHNPHGVKALVDSLDLFGDAGKKIVCVFSCMKDKEYGEMLKALGEKISVFVLVKPGGNERAAEPEELLGVAQNYAESYVSSSVGGGIEFAKGLAGKEGMVLITGSIYMMEEIYSALGKK